MNNKAKIIKTAEVEEKDMALINKYARRTLTSDEVYTFNVILCDNDVDRDFERFTEKALNTLADLFIGKTGIFDHNPSAENQAARIYSTEVLVDVGRKNALGQPYCYLEAKAYMLRNEKTAPLIEEIEGGIKKEVSVGCSMGMRTCSICGTQKGLCSHRGGEQYENRICYFELDNPTDAYEWSFVAIPAQRNAGVVKSLDRVHEGIRVLQENFDKLTPEDQERFKKATKEIEYLKFHIERTRREVRKTLLAEMTLAFPDIPTKLVASMVNNLESEAVLDLKKYFETRSLSAQLRCPVEIVDNGRFKI